MNDIKVLKFRNGELVIGKTVECEDNMIEITDPIAVVAVPVIQETIQGETFVLKPWIGISSNSMFVVPMDAILTVGELKLPLLKQYNKYVDTGFTPASFDEDETAFEQFTAAILRRRNLLN